MIKLKETNSHLYVFLLENIWFSYNSQSQHLYELFKLHLYTLHPSTPTSSNWFLYTVMIFGQENILWISQQVKFCSSCYVLPLWSKHSFPFLIKHPLVLLLECEQRKMIPNTRSLGSSVNIVIRLRAGRPGFHCRQGQWRDFISLPPRPDCLWSPASLLSSEYRWTFLEYKAVGAWS